MAMTAVVSTSSYILLVSGTTETVFQSFDTKCNGIHLKSGRVRTIVGSAADWSCTLLNLIIMSDL